MCYNFFKNKLCWCFLVIIFTGSCKKFVTVPPPQNEVVTASVFSNESSALSALMGLYSKMMSSNNFLMNGGISLYPALSADELFNTSPNASLDPFTANAIPSNSNIIYNNLWRWGYNYIYHANAILEGVAGSNTLAQNVKNILTGEAKFSRAVLYFYLVNLFGDVPLVLTTNYEINSIITRTPQAKVYDQMLLDLQEAQNLLPESYASTGRVRPNKWAANAMLARVHLYLQNWVQAESYSSEVISSGVYSLPSLNSIFLANSSEAIWQLLPVLPSVNSAEGNLFIPNTATVKPIYAVTPQLLNAFETGDGRKTTWLKANMVSSVAYFYPFKYKVRIASTLTEYNMVLRLAEQYLIRAEARAQQNKIVDSKTDLNAIRTRAGLAGTTANDKAALLQAIEQERRIEFFSEWGHRWFDLKRTGRINAVLSVIKPAWSSTAALFPVPETELNANPFLTQNPGY